MRIYGVEDNPKKVIEEGGIFLGMSLQNLIDVKTCLAEELWKGRQQNYF